jgi:hypothetical protein
MRLFDKKEDVKKHVRRTPAKKKHQVRRTTKK